MKFIFIKIGVVLLNVKKDKRKYIYLLNMLIIDVKNNENLEKSLKILKNKVIKTKQNQILNEKKEFEKKSVKKRKKLLKAIYSERIKNGL